MTNYCDKFQYETQKTAQAACAHIRSKNGMKIYKCRDCGMFHITSIKKNKVSFIVKEKYKRDYTHVKPVVKKKQIISKASDKRTDFMTTYKPFAVLLNFDK